MAAQNARSDDALPTPEQIAQADQCVLRDQQGNEKSFGEWRAGRQTVLVLIRHFHCGNCLEYVHALRANSKIQTLSPAGTGPQLLIVGCGGHEMIRRYKEMTDNPPFEILADPGKKLYTALSVTKRSTSMGDSKSLPSHHKNGTFSMIMSSTLETLKSGSKMFKAGDIQQLGADFVFRADGTPVFAHRMRHTRDHAEVSDLVASVDA